MSIEAVNWAFMQNISKSSAKLVLLAICNYADDKGVAYPSWTTLEKKCSSSRKTIYNSLKYLEELNLLHREDRGFIPANYDGGQNCYRVNLFASVKITPLQNSPSTSVKITRGGCKNYSNASVKITPKYKEKTKVETKDNIYAKKTISDRINDWTVLARLEIQPTQDQESIFNTFIEYWVAHNSTDKKFLAEKQKTFIFKQRFSTFLKNSSRTNNHISKNETNLDRVFREMMIHG